MATIGMAEGGPRGPSDIATAADAAGAATTRSPPWPAVSISAFDVTMIAKLPQPDRIASLIVTKFTMRRFE
jgi:hypothetical protein